jgi:two-component system, OmpR family, sensor kinase
MAMSLRLRLSLVFAIGTAALIAISGLVFLAQLGSSINAAIDATLRARSVVLVDELRAGTLRADSFPAGGAFGQQSGQHSGPGADEFAQVLTPRGSVQYPSGSENVGTLLSRAQLRQVWGKHALTATVAFEGERARILARPVRRGGHPAIVVVGVTTSVADAAQARAQAIILIGGPLAVVAAGSGAWLLTGAALGPVERMRRRLEDIAEHDSSARLTVPRTRDEIASLATTTNRVLDRLQQALARQRGFVADAGHELRTPLTALKAELELATRPGKSPDALAAAVSAAAADTDRLIRLAEDLLFLARADEGTAFLAPQQLDVSSLITASARSFAARADARTIAIATRAPEPLTALADPDRLRQALDNLLDNAIRHSPAGGAVEVTGSAREAPDGHRRASRRLVSIEVRDHGPGFPPDFLPHAFERFRRADPARGRADGGTGLGLAIVASIAAAHGGRAVADNDPSGGARVRIELPDRAA